ncbi:MAG: CDP-diacylglycerol--glycerol-3-phosphate 3-phosphatidyltransferase [Clostridiales bacterium]|nr:CDP-diacylglycerol--glycerol-3-phosphate 3-phosphatidyltransferase [Clostridiales bacterium]
MNLPNKLTILRVLLIPFFVLFFYLNFTAHYFVALAVFALAAITDFLDGYLARKYHLVTNLGKFLDPIADKVLVLTALIILLTKPEVFTANLGDWALVAAGCGVAIILARETIVSGFRMVAADAGIVIAADKIGKYKTVFQDLSVVILLVGMALAELTTHLSVQIINYVGLAFFAISVVLTLWSGVNYIVKNIQVLKV